ncbi:TetR/AcrR family transcriptional regulator [Phenylobacterium sp.]|jgi:AcrR family transcriptional regulator|uniref:TetR/AcrR family transcriptional regulator n=1 Tax=Phenylobacterium sp. TaxID=1871053 RepID=UPI002F92503E
MATRRLTRVDLDPPAPAEAAKADPKVRLVEVAARHFAEAGFEGASQRAIQREVGVNPATAHYYFGSKEALYRAVLERYLGNIQAERIAALPRANATAGASTRFHALLVAYLTPHIHTAATEGGYNYARILAAIQFTSPGPATTIINEAVNPVREMYVDALKALFPKTPRARIYTALHMTVMLMAMAPIRARDQLKDAKGRKALIEELITYSEAGFRAMCGEPTLK